MADEVAPWDAPAPPPTAAKELAPWDAPPPETQKKGLGILSLPSDVAELGARGIDYAAQAFGAAPRKPQPFSFQSEDPTSASYAGLIPTAKAVGQEAASAATLPRDVYAGKVDPASEEGIHRAAGLAAFALPVSPAAGTTKAIASGAVPRETFATRNVPPVGFPRSFPNEFARAVERDQDNPAALLQRLEEARQVKPQATLADVGGENVRGIVERVAQTPGAGRSTIVPRLTGRQQGQLTRISNDLSSALGTKQSAFRATTDTMESMKEAARPLYEQAYEAGDREIWSPDLERLTSAPAVQSAMRKAVTTWRNQAVADGYGAMNPGAIVGQGGLLKFTGKQVPAFPNIQFWDYTKRALDDQIGAIVKSGRKPQAFIEIDRQLRAALDSEVPSYAAARDAWSGPSKFLDSVENGKGILDKNMTAEELSHQFASMTESEQNGYRIGTMSAIFNKIGSNPAKLADLTRDLRSPEMRKKLAAIIPTPEAAERFFNALDYEIKSSELVGRSLAGSPTARRTAMQNEAAQMWGEMALTFASHGTSMLPMASSIWSRLGKPVRDTLRSRGDAILAELLTSARPFTPGQRLPLQSARTPVIALPPVSVSSAQPSGFKKGGRVTRSFRI